MITLIFAHRSFRILICPLTYPHANTHTHTHTLPHILYPSIPPCQLSCSPHEITQCNTDLRGAMAAPPVDEDHRDEGHPVRGQTGPGTEDHHVPQCQGEQRLVSAGPTGAGARAQAYLAFITICWSVYLCFIFEIMCAKQPSTYTCACACGAALRSFFALNSMNSLDLTQGSSCS